MISLSVQIIRALLNSMEKPRGSIFLSLYAYVCKVCINCIYVYTMYVTHSRLGRRLWLVGGHARSVTNATGNYEYVPLCSNSSQLYQSHSNIYHFLSKPHACSAGLPLLYNSCERS